MVISKSPGVFAWLSVVKRDCSFSSDSILSLVRLMVALMRCCSRSWRVLSESKSLSCFFSAISSKINGLPDAAAFIAPAFAASPSISSMTRVLISPLRTCSINLALFSMICHCIASMVCSVAYRWISTSKFSGSLAYSSLPWRIIRPSRCSRSDGRQGASMWCKATSRVCTLVPAPIFEVEPSNTRIRPLRTLLNSSSFCSSVLASWIKAISFSGIPCAINFCFMSSYTLKLFTFMMASSSSGVYFSSCAIASSLPSSASRTSSLSLACSLLLLPFGVDKSQNTNCVPLSAAVSRQIRMIFSTALLTLLPAKSGAFGSRIRISRAALRASPMILSILSAPFFLASWPLGKCSAR